MRLFLCSVISLLGTLIVRAEIQPIVEEKHRVFFNEYCVDCHNEKKQKGKVRLDNLAFSIDSLEKADLWQKILDSINAGDMPPEDEEQPAAEMKTEFLDHLGNTMVKAREVLSDSAGEIVMRRLNRREYQNTMRELLGVEVNASDLPSDRGAGTFDTVGASLFMSSDQTEQYFNIAQKALDDYFLIANTSQTKGVIYRLEPETVANSRLESWFKRSENFSNQFQSWKAEIDRVAASPENRDLMARLISENPKIKMPPSPNNQALYTHAAKLIGAPKIEHLGLGDFFSSDFHHQMFKKHEKLTQRYFSLPKVNEGAYLMRDGIEYPYGYHRIDLKPNTPFKAGKYLLRIRLGAAAETPNNRRFIEIGTIDANDPFNRNLAEIWSSHHVSGSLDQPQVLSIPVRLSGDASHISIKEPQSNDLKLQGTLFWQEFAKNGYGPEPVVWVDWVEVEKIPESSAENPVALANPQGLAEHAHAKQAFQILAERVYRGKSPSQEFLNKLYAIYEKRRAAGESHHIVLRDTLCIILSSPSFLYLREVGTSPIATADVPKAKPTLSAAELASRLSYFLWSSPPDQQLSKLAFSGELNKPEVLAREVERLIASPKSDEFVRGFVHQWLGLDRLDFFMFNQLKFQNFNDSMKATAREEVYETFKYLFKNKGSLTKLLKSDEIHVNAMLATFYGIPNVYGDQFQPVKVPAGSPRGGLLGMSAILAMGSDGDHTSPVERGAWVLRKLLHDPPPPAPPNVPQLTRLEGKLLTTKERLVAHMEEPQCASCHRKIDPVGFGLENFDAVGNWRTSDSYSKAGLGTKTWPIEPAGQFHNGPAFKNYFELRDLIAARSDDFAQGFLESLIEYALGRPYGFTDDDLAEKIRTHAKSKDYSIKEFVHALVQSEKFQSK